MNDLKKERQLDVIKLLSFLELEEPILMARLVSKLEQAKSPSPGGEKAGDANT